MARILVVEDDPEYGEWMTTTLNDSGFEVVTVRNGSEALTLMETGSGFDLVTTSSCITTPEMNGYVLTCQVQKYGVPVLIVSDESDPSAFIYARLAGARGWLMKSSNPIGLYRSVQLILDLQTLPMGLTLF